MSYAQAVGAMPSRADREYIPPNSKFCRWCQKRFANENVYSNHLTGKKHIKALERGGRKAEADAIRRKIDEAKKLEASKLAQANAAAASKKRKIAEQGANPEESTSKAAKADSAGSDRDLAAMAASAAKGQVSKDKVNLADKDQQALAMAYASGTAKPMVNMAVGEKWWEGTQHFDADKAAGRQVGSALSSGMDVTAGNRSTLRQARPEHGPGSGGGDWQCPGNHIKGRECGHWNFRNAEKCRKCGSYKRLS